MNGDVTLTLDAERLARVSEWEAEQVANYRIAGMVDWQCEEYAAYLRSLPWVESLRDAHFAIVGAALNGGPDPDDRAAFDTYTGSVRSWHTATSDEQSRYLGHFLGVSTQTARGMLRDASEQADDERAARPRRCSLYRYLDADGQLLYVGISFDPVVRYEQHRRTSPWFTLAADHTVVWFDSEAEARRAERDAIADESPLFNKTHNTADRDRALNYLLGRVSA